MARRQATAASAPAPTVALDTAARDEDHAVGDGVGLFQAVGRPIDRGEAADQPGPGVPAERPRRATVTGTPPLR